MFVMNVFDYWLLNLVMYVHAVGTYLVVCTVKKIAPSQKRMQLSVSV